MRVVFASVSRWASVFVGFCVVATVGRAEDAYPPEGLFEDSWMEVLMFGKKVGYAHATLKREDKVIRSRTLTVMKIKRAGSEVTMKAMEESRETLDGRMLGFTSEVNLGGTPVRREGVVRGNVVTVTNEQFGRRSTDSYELDERGLMNWGLLILMREKGFAPGTKYEAWIYSPDFGMAAPTKAVMETHGKESIELPGGKTNGIKVTTMLHSRAGNLETLNWVDDNGIALKTEMNLGGFPLEMLRTNKASALENFVSADLFTRSLLPLDGVVPRDAKAVTYELRSTDGGSLEVRPQDGEFQMTTKTNSGILHVRVERSNLKAILEGRGNPSQVAPEYRLPNVMIDANDPGIVTLARKAARGAKNPMHLAHHLRIFATRYVKAKTLGVGFATASEVVRTREGDCSEHAVLLAALGRASGLPSRVVAGLVYLPECEGRKNVMGFHMWTQFFLRGKWVDFDAALGESECAPTRIALATASLRDVSLSDLGFAIAEAIGGLQIRMLKVER